MLSLLSDENFNGDIIRGLLLRQPDLDLLRVQDVGFREVDDPAILAWAASHGPIRQVIDELLLLVDCSEQAEWKNIVLYLPL